MSNTETGELSTVWLLAFQDLRWDQFISFALWGTDRTNIDTSNEEMPDLIEIDENNNERIING